MAKTIFISYVREDAESAQLLFQDLRRYGYDPWIDSESLRGGQPFKREISHRIRNSDIVLVLISLKSVSKRGLFQAEVREAVEVYKTLPPGGIFLIPVRLDNTKPRHEELADLHWLDLFPYYAEGFRNLLDAIGPATTLAPDELIKPVHQEPEFAHGEVKRLLFVGEYEKAIEAYSQLIRHHPSMHSAYVSRAKALSLAGRTTEALDDLVEADD